jgi:hypothetical protein
MFRKFALFFGRMRIVHKNARFGRITIFSYFSTHDAAIDWRGPPTQVW